MTDTDNNIRRFDYKKPVKYNGEWYPTSDTMLVDEWGNQRSGRIFADTNGRYYTLDDNGNAHTAMPVNTLDEVVVKPSVPVKTLTPEEQSVNQQRQAYMRAAGYNVPNDGSWGPYQQSIWDGLTIKKKNYDTTLSGFTNGLWDKLTGNDTYRINPIDQGTVETYNPDNIDWDKTRRSQSKVVNALSGTWVPGMTAAVGLPALASAAVSAPLATAVTMGGGWAGGYGVDKASEVLTGRDFGTNVAMHTPLTSGIGELFNPGYYVGGRYGNFVGNNLANRGRYMLNYMTPASYGGHGKELLTTAIKPFYETPPTFNGGKKPVWYSNYASINGTSAAENRFQNGAIWAGIPEKEVPRTMYKRNYDGTYRMTNEGVGFQMYGLEVDPVLVPDETMIEPDVFTKGGVGGNHSNYTKLAEQNGIKLMEFKDEQKLNPQWQIADVLKKKFHISDASKAGKTIDYFGGKPIDWLAGYRPFTIKQDYLHDGNNVLPIFMDPIDPYLPVPISSADANVYQ